MIGKNFLRKDIAIDLGSANTLIAIKGQGIVLNEPSVLAVRRSAKEGQAIIAVGHEAKSMLGRAPESIAAVRPVQAGVIADFTLTTQMLKAFMHQVLKSGMFRPSPRITISVPVDSTQVERRAIREAAMSTGATDVHLVDAPVAAALGAGLPITQARGAMVLDLGAGTTELAILSLGGIVHKSGIRLGGDHLEESIINHVRREYGILIGERTAERVKIEMGSALPETQTVEMEIAGQKLPERIPRSVLLSSAEVTQALAEPLSQITSMVKKALQEAPAEVAADIAEDGIVVTGGGALLRNMDKLLRQNTGLPIRIADDPMACVVTGCGMAQEIISELPQLAAQEE